VIREAITGLARTIGARIQRLLAPASPLGGGPATPSPPPSEGAPPSATPPAAQEAAAIDVFPARCLRGLKSARCLHPEGERATPAAFEWNKATIEKRRAAGKVPGLEVSINWEDDAAHALELTVADEQNASAGVAAVTSVGLQCAASLPDANGGIFWERARLPANQFHGNIVCAEGVPKQVQHLASQVLATYSSVIWQPPPVEKPREGTGPSDPKLGEEQVVELLRSFRDELSRAVSEQSAAKIAGARLTSMHKVPEKGAVIAAVRRLRA
jgi:hypothetical protein